MARKKTAVAPDAPADQTDQTVTSAPEATTDGVSEPAGNGDKRKPIASYRLQSDRTTSIELAIWSNTFRNAANEEYEQLSITVQRSYKTDDGWQKGGSWRIHDIPCLLFLLQKSHAFCLDRRTSDSTIPF